MKVFSILLNEILHVYNVNRIKNFYHKIKLHYGYIFCSDNY